MTVKDNEKDIQNNRAAILKLSKIVLGNGDPGMDEDVREVKRRVGVIESEIKEIKKMVQDIVGYKGVRYDESNHPHRRANDKKIDTDQNDAERLVDWFTQKVLPGLVQNAIGVFFTVIIILAVLHWTDIF